MKKGVTGFSIILAAIIAIAILAILLLFLRSGLGGSLRTVGDVEEGVLTGTTTSAVKLACTRFCLEAKADPPNRIGWQISQFCTRKFAVDLDGDGKISADELIQCWQAPINATCSFTSKDREPLTEKQCE